jgi:signal transduction histidine kinase
VGLRHIGNMQRSGTDGATPSDPSGPAARRTEGTAERVDLGTPANLVVSITGGRGNGRHTGDMEPSGWDTVWDWARWHLAAIGYGLVLVGLAVAALVLTVLAAEPAVAAFALVISVFGHFSVHWSDAVPIGASVFGLVIAPFWVLAVTPLVRGLANQVRALSARWCGVPIELPYRSRRENQNRLSWMLQDRATWRDLLWLPVNGVAGLVLAGLPAALLVLGMIGFSQVALTDDQRIMISVAAIVGGVWAAPWLVRQYGLLARSLLAPSELERQVRHLTETRTETLDSGAAEIRRIERDLHDGAQARLVAMGMTLDAAGHLVDEDPKAARALLLEARDNSAKALQELRALVRGIHPPVLADRGLVEAIRALALDTPLRIHLSSDLDQVARPSAPIESAAYFAVNEFVANVAKHAQASQAWIDVRHNDGMLKITVSDDGQGGADPKNGTGLTGIERRLAAFDGVLAISSPPGGPTTVMMEIPCALR